MTIPDWSILGQFELPKDATSFSLDAALRVAEILGPFSACAKALDLAAKDGRQFRLWLAGGFIIVEHING